MSSSIITDERQSDTGDASAEFDAEEAFRKRYDDAERPSEGDEESTETEEAPDAPEDAEETTEEPSEAEEVFATDDHKVTVKVGDEEHKVAVKDLKRLFGQEASLTKKSQEATEALNRATTEGERAITTLDAMLKRAQDRFEPYKNVDFALAAQRLDEASYRQLKADAQAAFADVNFLQSEANVLLNTVRENRSKAHQEALKKCDEALAADPDTKGWDSKARDELAAYVISQGLPESFAKSVADPAAIKLIRKAMAHDKGLKAAQTKVKPAAKTAPTTSVRPGSRDATPAGEQRVKEAMSRLRKSGSADDAAAAFAARFGH